MSLRGVGDRAFLVDCENLDAVMGLNAALTASRPVGVIDIVPAARTVLVAFDPAVLAADRVAGWIRGTSPMSAGTPRENERLTVDVHYAGEDLAEVAAFLGLSERGVIDLHTAAVWRVAFVGFAPGFGYLVTDSTRLVVPRRSSPRTRVPAGSIGLAGEFTGVYPRPSPGGWQIIGHTDMTMWDETLDEPALLAPGRVVSFREAS